MIFLALLGFSTWLLSNTANCPPSDVPRGTPHQEKGGEVPSMFAYNDLPRREIMSCLTTGPTMDGKFTTALMEVLLGNLTHKIPDADLALWISALIARGENPRNQNGIDLVSDLRHRVDMVSRARPYLVLTLCNADAIARQDLEKMVKWTSSDSNYTHPKQLETDALQLKTLACARSLPQAQKRNLDEFGDYMQAKAVKLVKTNGYYTNVLTTSLVVQALTAYSVVIDPSLHWSEKEAVTMLRKSSKTSVIKNYYITMALNSRRVPFLKNLEQVYASQIVVRRIINVTLSRRIEGNPLQDFSIHLKVPDKWNLFEVFLRAGNLTSGFQFQYWVNPKGEPIINEVDGIPNDPERGLYWRFCHIESLVLYHPSDGETVALFYGTDKGC